MDALLFNTGDGGELNIDDNGVETTDGLETAAYLSLFCGDFWADNLQTDSEFKYPNRFWKLYQEIPVVPKNLSRFEDAAKKDLEELPVSSVTVTAQIIGLNKLKLTCQLDEDLFEFTENWDAMREKIGADYSYRAPDPEYLTGLRVLIKDGVNIAPEPTALTFGGTITYTGYEIVASGSFTIDSRDLIYDASTQPISQALFIEYGNSQTIALEDSRRLQLAVNTAGGVQLYTNFGGTPTQTITLKPSGVYAGWLFIALVVSDGRIKAYLNTDVSDNVTDTLRLVYDQPQTDGIYSGTANPTNTGSTYPANKYTVWDVEVSLSTLQSWYDLGPTGDPL